jgi:hypothetical protein
MYSNEKPRQRELAGFHMLYLIPRGYGRLNERRVAEAMFRVDAKNIANPAALRNSQVPESTYYGRSRPVRHRFHPHHPPP